MKNIIIGLLILIIIGLGGYMLFNKSKKNLTNSTFSNNAEENLIENKYLSEKQIERKHVYQMLINEMIANVDKHDTTLIDCGTRLTPSQYDKISNVFPDVCSAELIPDDTTKILDFPIFFHMVIGNTQEQIISKNKIADVINLLNDKYREAKIKFTIKGNENIVSDNFANFQESDEVYLLRQYNKNNMINIFVFNSITSLEGSKLNGYTTYSQNENFIMMALDAIQNGTTLSHEMGHFFSLYHTHGKTNNGSTDELVNRVSCSCKGDDVCDTPADPNLYGIIGSDCVYKGNQRDADRNIYSPDPKNLMSYAHLCRNYFSKGQYNRIRWSALKYRNYFFDNTNHK